MAKYEVVRDTWISHLCIVAKEGTILETDFPKVNGKPMKIGDNLKEVKGEKTPAAPADPTPPAPGSDLT